VLAVKCGGRISSSCSPGTSASFHELFDERYVSLTSFRRNGVEVSTPVWVIALEGRLYARTDVVSGKVKRIRRQPRVRLAACTRSGIETGPRVAAHAGIYSPSARRDVIPALDRKYGLLSRGVGLLTWLRRRQVVIVELGPR